MTLTLKQLLEAQPALQRLGNEKLPVKVAYNVARLLKDLQVELDEFHRQRGVLVDRFGTKRVSTDAERPVHGPEVIEVLTDKMADFRKEIDDLVSVVVTINREPLSLEGIPDITPADLIVLEPLFKGI